jgi:DNA-binding IscR family transcriptional regulator
VRALEGPIEPQICTAEGDAAVNCVLQPGCATHHVWMSLQSSIAKALDGMSLHDLAAEKLGPAGKQPTSSAPERPRKGASKSA